MAKETCIVMAQLKLLVGDLEGNTTSPIVKRLRSFNAIGRFTVFSELAVTAYPPEDLLLHQSFLKQVDIQIERLCQATQDIGIIVGAPRQHAGHLYNAALYLEDGKIQAEHFKTELPNYSVFDEKRYFTAGLEPCVIDIDGLHIAIAICEDLWQPNVVQQLQSNHAVDMIVHINASPFYMDKSERRLEALRAQQNYTNQYCM
ncbi:MAG: nitrilase-related carbon-nitrogen hydrolase [Candidatus Oxydemutatoraceae bacterium WSBS_2016_MAG_OTU14]